MGDSRHRDKTTLVFVHKNDKERVKNLSNEIYLFEIADNPGNFSAVLKSHSGALSVQIVIVVSTVFLGFMLHHHEVMEILKACRDLLYLLDWPAHHEPELWKQFQLELERSYRSFQVVHYDQLINGNAGSIIKTIFDNGNISTSTMEPWAKKGALCDRKFVSAWGKDLCENLNLKEDVLKEELNSPLESYSLLHVVFSKLSLLSITPLTNRLLKVTFRKIKYQFNKSTACLKRLKFNVDLTYLPDKKMVFIKWLQQLAIMDAINITQTLMMLYRSIQPVNMQYKVTELQLKALQSNATGIQLNVQLVHKIKDTVEEYCERDYFTILFDVLVAESRDDIFVGVLKYLHEHHGYNGEIPQHTIVSDLSQPVEPSFTLKDKDVNQEIRTEGDYRETTLVEICPECQLKLIHQNGSKVCGSCKFISRKHPSPNYSIVMNRYILSL